MSTPPPPPPPPWVGNSHFSMLASRGLASHGSTRCASRLTLKPSDFYSPDFNLLSIPKDHLPGRYLGPLVRCLALVAPYLPCPAALIVSPLLLLPAE
jgi:hypothetical protein